MYFMNHTCKAAVNSGQMTSSLAVCYTDGNILEVAQQVNTNLYILSAPISCMFCTECVGYRLMVEAMNLLIHGGSSLKVSPSGISPSPWLYFYCMLKAKHAFVQKHTFMNQFFKYKNTIPVVEGYFSTMFLSRWNTSPPHRCVTSKINGSKGTLHSNRPVILNQGS